MNVTVKVPHEYGATRLKGINKTKKIYLEIQDDFVFIMLFCFGGFNVLQGQRRC